MIGRITRALSGGVFAASFVTLTAAALLSTTSTAFAQSYAMGGAGIAQTREHGVGARSNPASLAFEPRDFLPTFPSRALLLFHGVLMVLCIRKTAFARLPAVNFTCAVR